MPYRIITAHVLTVSFNFEVTHRVGLNQKPPLFFAMDFQLQDLYPGPASPG